MSKTTNNFGPEVRERALRMVLDHERDHPLRCAAVVSIAKSGADVGRPAAVRRSPHHRYGECQTRYGEYVLTDRAHSPEITGPG